MAVMYGPDVSSNQPSNVLSKIKYDFGIVKMSGNPQGHAWNYVNPYAATQAKAAYNKTGCLGLYHFTWGKDANTEADFFVNEVKKLGYLNKAILIIDYEAEAVDLGRSWVKKFADRVKAKAGYAPMIYASGSVIVDQDLFGLGYPIWCANYYNGYEPMYGWSIKNCKIYSGCEKSILWQYTSQGYINGYDGALDCNIFYGSKADWQKLAGMKVSTSTATTVSITKYDNTDLARAACKLAYSRKAQYNPSTKANPRTVIYGKVYDKLFKNKDTKTAAPHVYNVQGRSCDRSIATAVLWSGWDDSFPRMTPKIREHLLSSSRWKNLGFWDGKESSLQPGDILIRIKGYDKATSNHVCMYVGKTIAQEIYKNYVQGTDGDKGKPYETATWMSGHLNGGNPPNKGYAPCLGNAAYAGANKLMKVFRCIKPQKSTKYTKIVIMQPINNKTTTVKTIATLAQEVIDGKWGSGASRKTKLEEAGYDYDTVQNKVNDIIYTKIAKEVIAGKWGKGTAQKAKLENAGYNYEKIQAKVNNLLG